MTKKKHPQQHLFPIISLMLVLIGIIIIDQSEIRLTAWHVTSASIIYLLGNISYGLVKKQLTFVKTIEFLIVAAFANYIALIYII